MPNDSDTYDSETFVYDSKEVIKTGRIATKTTTNRRGQHKTLQLIEVCPLDMVNQQNKMFHSWVEEHELFSISGDDCTEDNIDEDEEYE